MIEAIVNDAVERAMAFSPCDQSFIYSEVSDRLSDLSHTALITEYGFKEEDFERVGIMHVFIPSLTVCLQRIRTN